jgi:hypothetical protein
MAQEPHSTLQRIVFLRSIIAYTARDVIEVGKLATVTGDFRETLQEYSNDAIQNLTTDSGEDTKFRTKEEIEELKSYGYNRKKEFMENLSVSIHRAGISWLSVKLYEFCKKKCDSLASFPDNKNFCNHCLKNRKICTGCQEYKIRQKPIDNNYFYLPRFGYQIYASIPRFNRRYIIDDYDIYFRDESLHSYNLELLLIKFKNNSSLIYDPKFLRLEKEYREIYQRESIILKRIIQKINNINFAAEHAYQSGFVNKDWVTKAKNYTQDVYATQLSIVKKSENDCVFLMNYKLEWEISLSQIREKNINEQIKFESNFFSSRQKMRSREPKRIQTRRHIPFHQ